MKKSSGKKRTVHRKTGSSGKVTKIIHESTKEIKIEKALIENFIALQKVMIHLSGKFDVLSSQISKLLELFEISAKSLAGKDLQDVEREGRESKKIMEKLDNLTQQAGLIGRGLALIHESNNERYMPERQSPQPVTSQGTTPQMQYGTRSQGMTSTQAPSFPGQKPTPRVSELGE